MGREDRKSLQIAITIKIKMKLIKRKIDINLADEIKRQLIKKNLLCNSLLENINSSKGNFYIYCPPTIKEEYLYSFDTAGHWCDDKYNRKVVERESGEILNTCSVPDINEDIYAIIRSYFQKGKINQIFINDILTKMGNETMAVLYQGTEYTTLLSENSSIDIPRSENPLLENINGIYLHWYFLCFGLLGGSLPKNLSWSNILKYSEGKVTFIMIGIYDGEGLIVWERL